MKQSSPIPLNQDQKTLNNIELPHNLEAEQQLLGALIKNNEFLEYEFMKIITQVNNPERTVIGLITQLDIDGGFDPMTGQGT